MKTVKNKESFNERFTMRFRVKSEIFRSEKTTRFLAALHLLSEAIEYSAKPENHKILSH